MALAIFFSTLISAPLRFLALGSPFSKTIAVFTHVFGAHTLPSDVQNDQLIQRHICCHYAIVHILK